MRRLTLSLSPPKTYKSVKKPQSLLRFCTVLIASSLMSAAVSFAAPKKVRPVAAPTSSVSHVEKFVGRNIHSIDVRGLKRIEKDAVLGKLVSKAGVKLSTDTLRADVQALFGMGYFEDLEVKAKPAGAEVDLLIVVKERPAIAKIDFDGNERISNNDLKDVIKIKEWSILDYNKVKEDVALIQKHYEEKGFYLAKVTYEIKNTKPDEVELVYKINDYEKVQIKKITFLNNKRFSDDELKATFMETREGGMFSFMNGTGNFKESAFKTDLQRLTYFYLDHGYVKFRYENPVVTISDDKKYLFISVYVEEGDPYTMGELDFSGDLLFTKDELHEDITLKKDNTFSISKRNADIQKLTERYQDLGYAFVNVIPKMNVRDDVKRVDIDYSFEKGNLAYFGEINITGNTKTYDKVIRRELKIREGELYHGTRLRQSRENVERLGYFAPGEVVFNTISPKGKPNVLNVEISVKERSTGTITLGAGYGSVQKFFFTTQVSEINFLGRGQTISFQAQLAADRLSKSLSMGFTEPYTFDTRWSTGFDLYFVNFPIPSKYVTRKLGFDLRAGYPIFEYTNAYVTYKNEGMQIIDPDPSVDRSEIRADQGILSSLVYSVTRDRRNNRFETTDGNYQSLSLETAGLGGDKEFIKWNANNRIYYRLFGDLVLRNSTQYGQINPVNDKPIPPSEKFYLGGPNNLKGFNLFALGPSRIRTTSFGYDVREPLGGRIELFSLLELEYPLIREAGLKWVVFYDAGNTFSQWPGADTFTLRSDAGFGIRWFSPIGPLRFEWGFPFARKPYEDASVFNFFIGPPF